MNSKNYVCKSSVKTSKGEVFIAVVALALVLTLPLYGQQTAKDVPTATSGSSDRQASAADQQTQQEIVQALDVVKKGTEQREVALNAPTADGQTTAVTEEAAKPASARSEEPTSELSH